MLKLFTRKLGAVCCVFLLGAAQAQPPTPAEVQSLDEQVQAVKSDVLAIAAELGTLEEQLLFPSNTQISVFVALEKSDAFRLDALELRINDALATHHIYSFPELDALARGGVQRLFTGNLTRGDHRLDVTVVGTIRGEEDYSHTQTFHFTKDIDPRMLGLAVAGPSAGKEAVTLNEM